MPGPIALLTRQIMLRKHQSQTPTGIRPMSGMSRVTVLIDSTDPELESLKREMNSWFAQYPGVVLNIQAIPFSLNFKGCLNLLGLFRKKGRSAVDCGNEDMLVVLSKSTKFALRYAVATSRASFKVGREQLRNSPFDLVIEDPDFNFRSQREVFAALSDVLSKIK